MVWLLLLTVSLGLTLQLFLVLEEAQKINPQNSFLVFIVCSLLAVSFSVRLTNYFLLVAMIEGCF